MVTFSLGTNSKRAANGSAARRIVMQMVPEGLPGPAAGRWHARRGKLCHSPLSPLNSINGESHVSSRRRKQVKTPAEGWRWRGGTWGHAGTHRAGPGPLTGALPPAPRPGGLQECPSFGMSLLRGHRGAWPRRHQSKKAFPFFKCFMFAASPASPGLAVPPLPQLQRGWSREQKPVSLPQRPRCHPRRDGSCALAAPPGHPGTSSRCSPFTPVLLAQLCIQGPGSASRDPVLTPAGMSLEHPSSGSPHQHQHPGGHSLPDILLAGKPAPATPHSSRLLSQLREYHPSGTSSS